MLCRVDGVQMLQHNAMGGGHATDLIYETWMVLRCPKCEVKVVEVYKCKQVTDEELATHVHKIISQEKPDIMELVKEN